MTFEHPSARSFIKTARSCSLFYAIALLGLVCVTHPASAQFVQQGTAMHGGGNVGPDREGSSVAISADGSTAIIGGPDDSQRTGATWVFSRRNGTWTQQGPKLVGSGARPDDREGFSVALSSDGNTALIGCPGDSGGSGAVLAFTRLNGNWTFQSKLTGQGRFGTSVSLSSDGNTGLVGVASTGAASVITRSAGTWVQQANTLRGRGGGSTLEVSVALSGDGKTAIVGTPGDDFGKGAATVFTQIGGVWSQQGTRLSSSDADSQSQQGFSVSLSFDGLTAAVGGPGSGRGGAAWIFSSEGGVWSQQGKLVGSGNSAVPGSSVSLSPDGAMISVGGFAVPPQPGAAPTGVFWVFTRASGAWTQQAGPVMPSDAVGGSTAFWVAVAMSSDERTVVLGQYGNTNYYGAAWFFVARPPRTARLVSGVVNPDGSIASGATGGFTVEHQNGGQYKITFAPPFAEVPAIVGSQVSSGTLSQNPRDNVVFPFLNAALATVITGDDEGNHQDRAFSFIARGIQ